MAVIRSVLTNTAHKQPGQKHPQKYPQFGALDLMGQTLLQAAVQHSSQAAQHDKERHGTFRKLIQWNIILTPLLTLLLANIDTAMVMQRRLSNRWEGKPLASVVVPESNQWTPADWLKTLQTDRVILQPEIVYQAAKAGYIRELFTPSLEKTNNAGITEWVAVLIDGTEVSAELDLATRTRLTQELKIPIRRAISGLSIGWLEAGVLSTFIVSGLSTVLSGRAQIRIRPTPEEEKRTAVSAMGRQVVASRLGVSEENLTLEALQEQMQQTQPGISLKQLKGRLAVLMAGEAIEAIFFDKDASVVSLNARTIAVEVAEWMVGHLGESQLFPYGVPKDLTETQKQQIQKEIEQVVMTAHQQSREILGAIPKERLQTLLSARQKWTVTTQTLNRIINDGVSLAQLRKEQPLWRRKSI
ncbi:MAG: hypothetical protein K2X01_01575 [Cyanobacteria bacterium]|nr:hypothetical protein [Cyanobacteriota bacterium]